MRLGGQRGTLPRHLHQGQEVLPSADLTEPEVVTAEPALRAGPGAPGSVPSTAQPHMTDPSRSTSGSVSPRVSSEKRQSPVLPEGNHRVTCAGQSRSHRPPGAGTGNRSCPHQHGSGQRSLRPGGLRVVLMNPQGDLCTSRFPGRGWGSCRLLQCQQALASPKWTDTDGPASAVQGRRPLAQSPGGSEGPWAHAEERMHQRVLSVGAGGLRTR